MSATLHLTITTPMDLLVDEPAALSIRAEDESGGFGILPGHTDFLTVLSTSVMRWRNADGREGFCALRGGVMTMAGGRRAAVACREGILGGALDELEAAVDRLREEEADADRQVRVEQIRLHADAVRQLMRYLQPGRPGVLEHPPALSSRPGGMS